MEDTSIDPTQETTEQVIERNEALDKVMDFSVAKTELQRLVNEWDDEVTETEIRRKTRDVEFDVEGAREKGDIDEDETLIPVRVIDVNIQREQPPYINYLKNSRRMAIFKSWDNPNQDTQLLEEAFTEGMAYEGWETPYFKCLDGAQTHGWDAVEVVYDDSKPYKVGVEHIGHDCLFFPTSAKDFQSCPQIIRKFDVTRLQLQEFVTLYSFDESQVKIITDKVKDSSEQDETITIYRRYIKYDGKVFVSWFTLSDGCSDWIKKPLPLFVGISTQDANGQWIDAPVKMYPIFVLPYRESEKPKLTDRKGRVFLDENKQEAQTSILSAFVNSLHRASKTFASPATDDGTGSSVQALTDVKLANSTILNKPFNFWHQDYPDPLVLRSLQYFDVANANETNQVNFAAMNREDSRKTAREISAAQQQQTLLDSVQLTLFSTFCRSILNFEWLIVQSLALQNKISFLRIEQKTPVMNPMTGQPVIGPDGQPLTNTTYVNNIAIIGQRYNVKAAGDVDVVMRQEKILQMKQDWPVVQNTPLAQRFLADLMKLEYPDQGELYYQILMQTDQMKALQGQVMALGTIIKGVMEQHPEIFQSLPAQSMQQLQQIMSTIPAQPQRGAQ